MPRERDLRLAARAVRGRAGEEIAARHLSAEGFEILQRNVVLAGVELDIVALDEDCVVFVEVRARASDRFGDPALSVDRAKQRRVARGAQAWLLRFCGNRVRARFDVVGVWWVDGVPTVSHYRDAFSSPLES